MDPTADIPHDLTPEDFLTGIDRTEPGWSDRFGGLVGVAALCAKLNADLVAQSEEIARVRAAAINELLKAHSGAQVGAMLGLSRASVFSNRRNHPDAKEQTW